MKLELLTMCHDCKAIQIKEKPEKWIRYNLFNRNWYNNLVANCKSLIYGYCPGCSGKLRKANKVQ